MICDICKVNTASVHFSSFQGGEVAKMHICHSCAVNMGVFDGNMQEKSFDILGKFLSALAQSGASPAAKCPDCAKTLEEFREDGKLGCPKCWETFRANLEPLLKKLHGRSRHKQDDPEGKDSPVCGLRMRLQDAVKREDYEKAAKLRDEIRALEEKK